MSSPIDNPLPLEDLPKQKGWLTRLREVKEPYSAEKVDSSKVTVTMVRAIWDFEARDDTELSFKKGDHIIITIQAEGGWWQGQLEEKEGKIPINRVLVTQILEKKRNLKINQDKVTNRIKALQRLVSRENVHQEAPAAPKPTSSPLAEKSPISTRRRRAISTKLANSQITPRTQAAEEAKEKAQLELEERRAKRQAERERRQRVIEQEEQMRKRQLEEEEEEESESYSTESSELSESETSESEFSESESDSSESKSGEGSEDGNTTKDKSSGDGSSRESSEESEASNSESEDSGSGDDTTESSEASSEESET